MRALGRVALVPAAAVTFLLALVPVLAVLVLGAPGLTHTLADPALASAVRQTAYAATPGALAGWAAGVLAAFGIWGRTPPSRRVVLGAAWTALLAPYALTTEGWLPLVQGHGAAARLAAGIAQAAPAAGLVLLIVTAGLNRLDPQVLRSAAASGAAPLQAWQMAVLPALAWPLCLAGAAAFAICLARPPSSYPVLGGLLNQEIRHHDVAAAPDALLLGGLSLAPLLPLGLLALLVRRFA